MSQNPNPYFSTNDQEPEIVSPETTNLAAPVPGMFKTNSTRLNAFLEKFQQFVLKRWWIILIVTVAISLTFITIFVVISLNKSQPAIDPYDKVLAKIEGPDSLSKGSPDTWKITVENKESTPIQNVQVELNFDSNFEFIMAQSPSPDTPKGNKYSISRLDAFKEGLFQTIITIKGSTKGNIDEDILMGGTVTYIPDALARAQNTGKLAANANIKKTIALPDKRTKTTAAKISLLMGVKDEIVPNNGIGEVNLDIENTSERDIKDLRIRYFYPVGFTYQESVLSQNSLLSTKTKPDDSNNIWNLNLLPRLNKQNLKVKGALFGAGGVNMTFRVDIEIKNGDNWQSISTVSRDITIAAKPLVLTAKINNAGKNFKPGETLNVTVNYENQGTNTVRNAEITASIQDPSDLLDWNTVVFSGGERANVTNKSIKWTGNTLPQLANLGVRVRGEVNFSIKLKEESQFINTLRNENEYILIPQASATGQNIQPLQVSGETVKAKGDIGFVAKITDLGPDPAQINKHTFRVIWELSSKQNKLGDVVLRTRSTLQNPWRASSITPTAKNSEITYNPANGEIIWTPQNVPSYSGISQPVVTISFEMTVEKGANDTNSSVEVYKDLKLSAIDNFTGEKFDKQVGTGNSQFIQ